MDPRVRDHEACHGAAASLVGIEVDGYAFDRMGWDGWVGQTVLNHDALRALEGTYRDRLAVATLAFMPYVVLLGEPEGKGDMALVEAMRPHDHSARLWNWLVEQDARRLFRTDEFLEAFGAARDRIEQQLAEV
jgi:hypothetical protein